MATYAAGMLVLLAFPFSDGVRAKQRPALVLLDTGDPDLLVARVTSREAGEACDVKLTNWHEAGLLLPSTVRLHKLTTLEKHLVKRTLGRLTDEDWTTVRRTLETLWRGCEKDG
ncbi:MAG: type II toxin-antitoxin system PemK/MazF family toxin [Deinococcota bacterium]|jgi:mRNA interferase MazF|nr:type II toxin-antitoxin system PemK/MazF family toxin [Deinococcota bacterium]